jgi:GAF domain-containing protein
VRLCRFMYNSPRSILNYVLHSQKSVILADASTDMVFGSDPCIRSGRIKSILCLPLVVRNSLIRLVM